jgi:hypothetical protein
MVELEDGISGWSLDNINGQAFSLIPVGGSDDMSKLTKSSVTYTLVFCLGYFVACTGANTKGNTAGSLSAATARMLNSTVRNTAIFPTNTGNQPVLASMFGSRAHADATISNPSALGQSYETVCSGWGASGTSIHATFGNSGLLPLNFGNAGIEPGNICAGPPLASVGVDENGTPTGFPIILPGTINNLAVYGVFLSGNRFRCLDTTDTTALQDNTYVRPYYDLAHDAIVLGSGTTQLTVTCSLSIPAGDDVQTIQLQWVKD